MTKVTCDENSNVSDETTVGKAEKKDDTANAVVKKRQ